MDAGILPEVYRKFLTAKKYLATGKAASVKEAAQLAGISRSAYYKYKDAIFEYGTSASDEVATVKARLQDSAGVLSSFIGAISRVGGNVLSACGHQRNSQTGDHRGGTHGRDRAHCRSVCGACPFTGAFGAVERCCWRRIYSVNL